MKVTGQQIGIILLAAGSASRMGMPKQLLVYEQQPLIRHLIGKLLDLQSPICVVLGARAAMIRPVIEDFPVQIVVSEHWERGMGASLKSGLLAIEQAHPTLAGVLVCVADQPFLSTGLLQQFLTQFRTNPHPTAIFAARYASQTIGVPVLFSRYHFPLLEQMEDAAGAKKILSEQQSHVIPLDFPQGDFDLDHPEDWDSFRNQ
jgi:molybdenum cofactor cytidylyltransferase